MTSDLGEFLKSEWAKASPTQAGSKLNPIVEPASAGLRLSNGTRVPNSGMGQAPPIGTTPEVPVTASTIGVPAPDCGPKMQAVIDPNTGRWTCQPTSSSGPSLMQLAMYAGLGYLAWKWYQDQSKTKRHKSTSEETEYDD